MPGQRRTWAQLLNHPRQVPAGVGQRTQTLTPAASVYGPSGERCGRAQWCASRIASSARRVLGGPRPVHDGSRAVDEAAAGLPRDGPLLALPGARSSASATSPEVEWRGGRAPLQLAARRNDPTARKPMKLVGLQASDCDRMPETPSRRTHTVAEAVLVTSLATQTLLPGTTGRHWMELVPLLSSHDGPGWV
jgi:hypothetical protein